jgi:uncharacterized protein
VSYKFQRIRDPLHNLIEFQGDEFHDTMWRVIQTPEFQRLRRIKQLGFSELVYPGANHTRFAHSVGVFHTARKLINVIWKHLDEKDRQDTKKNAALAAALVHDLGHGPYSHAFEEVGRKLSLPMASHEKVTDSLVRTGEVGRVLNNWVSGFASDVADMIAKTGRASIYGAVVSSQFDADRLDYMQRDRLMTGTHHGAIDLDWLISNLEVGKVPHGVDQEKVGEIETFVLGPKALLAAETYLLSIFQLYATVYLHKATRGAEKLFTELLARLFKLTLDGSIDKTGLNDCHPLIRFAKSPEKLECALALDDAVISGALFMLTESRDDLVSDFSKRLRDRRLYKCIDVRERLAEGMRLALRKKASARKKGKNNSQMPKATKLPKFEVDSQKFSDELDRACKEVEGSLTSWGAQHQEEIPRILLDKTERSMYKPFEESRGPLEQIMIRLGKDDSKPVDVASVSQVIRAIAPFKVQRVYIKEGDDKAKIDVEQIIDEEIKKCRL